MLHSRNIRPLEDSGCETCLGHPRHRGHPEEFQEPRLHGLSLGLPEEVRVDAVLVVLWHIWKARNALIFDQETTSPQQTIRRMVAVMEQWRRRCRGLGSQWMAWADYLGS
ncbi:hypothetical protein HU200_047565 [Digitaria exilis]|uniref:Uncharacterized protein n=1 Tax=Digitaria exilis TaxID=1010633 RepID=A0A835AV14_9POAL|nr:hypothetical protein HU200_047565 [Digitaria exilis]